MKLYKLAALLIIPCLVSFSANALPTPMVSHTAGTTAVYWDPGGFAVMQ